MNKNENIIKFAQNILGCGCPAEVFEFIETENIVRPGKEILVTKKINIGNRLLIYIFMAPDEDQSGYISELISTGRKERDSKGYNRFRLVIAVDSTGSNSQKWDELFQSSPHVDEKVHLHILEKKDVPSI